MADLCTERGVGLLCYGTLLGGLLSEKWIGKPRPKREDFTTVSEMKVWRGGGSQPAGHAFILFARSFCCFFGLHVMDGFVHGRVWLRVGVAESEHVSIFWCGLS